MHLPLKKGDKGGFPATLRSLIIIDFFSLPYRNISHRYTCQPTASSRLFPVLLLCRMLSNGWVRTREGFPASRNYIRWSRTKRTFRLQKISGIFCSLSSVRGDLRYNGSCRAYTGHGSGGNCCGHRKRSHICAHRRRSGCRSTASSSNSSSCRIARIADGAWRASSEVLMVLSLKSYFAPIWNGEIEQQYGHYYRVRARPPSGLLSQSQHHAHVFFVKGIHFLSLTGC